MAAPAFRAQTSSTVASTAGKSLTFPALCQVGDIAYFILEVDTGGVVTPPDATWTEVKNALDGGGVRYGVWEHVIVAGEPGNSTGTFAYALSTSQAGLVAYSGASTTSPRDVTGATQETAAGTSVAAPSVTTTGADETILTFEIEADVGNSKASGSSQTPRLTASSVTAMDNSQAVAGASGTKTINSTATANRLTGFSIALKAPAVVTTSFANVRAFQEYEDPDAFQQSAFQRPDPALAFQESRLQPEAFQQQAFQKPSWIQAFQDTAFDDEGFQEAADAFQDNALQGDAFQQDERPQPPRFARIVTVLRSRAALVKRIRRAPAQILRSRVFPVRARPPVVSSETLDRSRRSVRVRRRRPIILRAIVAAVPARRPVLRPQTGRSKLIRTRRRRPIIVRALFAALPPRKPVLGQQTGNRARLLRSRRRRPTITRAPAAPLVTFTRPTVRTSRATRRAQTARIRRRPPLVLRAPSSPTPTPLVRKRLVIELDTRPGQWFRLGRGRRRKPLISRAPQPAAPPAVRPRPPVVSQRSRGARITRARHDQPVISRSRVEPRQPTKPTLIRRLRTALVARRRRKQPIIVRPVRSVATRPRVIVHTQLRRRPRHHAAIITRPVRAAAPVVGFQLSAYGDVLVSDTEMYSVQVSDTVRYEVQVSDLKVFNVAVTDTGRFDVLIDDDDPFMVAVGDQPGR